MNNTGYKYREIAKILKANGFTPVSGGKTSHIKWVRGSSEHIVVDSTGVNRMIWRRLCKEHNLTNLKGTDRRK